MVNIHIFIDGSGWNGQESKACVTDNDGKVLTLIKTNTNKTNNQMEYQALFAALLDYVSTGDEIFTDSKLLVGQVTQHWNVNVAHLKMINKVCKELLEAKKIKLTWVPREQNKAGLYLEKLSYSFHQI